MMVLRSSTLEGGTAQPIQANCTSRANGKIQGGVCLCVFSVSVNVKVCVLNKPILVSLIICFLLVNPTVCVKDVVLTAPTDNYWILSSTHDFRCVCVCVCV